MNDNNNKFELKGSLTRLSGADLLKAASLESRVKPISDDAYEAIFQELSLTKEPGPTQQPAIGFLEEARAQMEQRAKLRDTPNGERTAKKISSVFNALTGHNLSEGDAWTFLIVMKMVRGQAGTYNRDDYVDLSAYASLLGECESARERK